MPTCESRLMHDINTVHLYLKHVLFSFNKTGDEEISF